MPWFEYEIIHSSLGSPAGDAISGYDQNFTRWALVWKNRLLGGVSQKSVLLILVLIILHVHIEVATFPRYLAAIRMFYLRKSLETENQGTMGWTL